MLGTIVAASGDYAELFLSVPTTMSGSFTFQAVAFDRSIELSTPYTRGVGAIGCTRQWDPQCGFDGVTQSNECTADVEGVVIEFPGECP